MCGTPQRSRRISTGLCRPGRGTVPSCRACAAKPAQHIAKTARIYFSDFEALGVEVDGLESVLPALSALSDFAPESDEAVDSLPLSAFPAPLAPSGFGLLPLP